MSPDVAYPSVNVVGPGSSPVNMSVDDLKFRMVDKVSALYAVMVWVLAPVTTMLTLIRRGVAVLLDWTVLSEILTAPLAGTSIVIEGDGFAPVPDSDVVTDEEVVVPLASLTDFWTSGKDDLSIFEYSTEPSAIAAVVTAFAGKGAFSKSPRVIFLVTDADASTIAISSALSAVVSDGNWLIRGKVVPSLSYYRCV